MNCVRRSDWLCSQISFEARHDSDLNININININAGQFSQNCFKRTLKRAGYQEMFYYR